MAHCRWCGREYDPWGSSAPQGYCSMRCCEEERATRRAEKESEKAEEASARAEEASRQAAIAAEQRAAETRALRVEIKKQRLDAKAQAEGFVDNYDKLVHQFDNTCEQLLELLRKEFHDELQNTSEEDVDLRLAKFIKEFIDSQDEQSLFAEEIAKNDAYSSCMPIITFDPHFDFPLWSSNKFADKNTICFLFAKFYDLSSFDDGGKKWDNSWWKREISFSSAVDYLKKKYCNTSDTNEIKKIFDEISNHYNQKKAEEPAMKRKVRAISITSGIVFGLILSLILININAESLDKFIGGGFTVIGLIFGIIIAFSDSGSNDNPLAWIIGSACVLGAIGFGIAKALTIPAVGVPLFMIIFGAAGFGIAHLIIEKKRKKY